MNHWGMTSRHSGMSRRAIACRPGRAMRTGLALIVSAATAVSAMAAEMTYDIVIYGGTSSGVVAALQAKRMGRTSVIVEPGKYLGGLTTGGLGATDIGNKAAIGGIAREFYQRVGKHYGEPEAWKFEPHVAQAVMADLAKESGALILRERRLRSVSKDGNRITSITLHDGTTLAGRMFIDATYEGDLMAMAGVSYTVGREANATYNETLNGVQFGQRYHQFDVAVDAYRIPGDPTSGLLPRISADPPGEHGQGDHRVQAYCFRMCLTQREDIRIPFPKPEGYDRDQYALLARYLQNAEKAGLKVPILNHVMMPNGKTDTNNNGAFSTDNIGMNYEYPEASWEKRQEIIREHEVYQKGLMYFLANDESVPERVRKEVASWGLCKDEFTDNGGWPHQLYIREARRMVSDYVMTQHNCQLREVASDAVGLAAYGMDSHNCQRYVRDGIVLNEGDVQVWVPAPYPISYRSIVPKAGECENLAVSVCVSASHIAFGSIRMEPVFMILGQSAATAAVLAIEDKVPLQKVDYEKLRERLLADKQILKWTGPIRKIATGRQLPGIVVDDAQAQRTGSWSFARTLEGFVGDGYLHDRGEGKGESTVRFPIRVKEAGRYAVRLSVLPASNRATAVPVTVRHAGGTETVKINQKQPETRPAGRSAAADGEADPTDQLAWVGEYEFRPDSEAWVEISNAGTEGHVIADAVQLLPLK